MPGASGSEGFGEGFGDVLRGDEVDGEADGIGGVQGGGADDGDVFGELGEVEELGSTVEGFDGVGAGEEEPVVGAEAGEGGVEGGEGRRGGDFDGGDEDGGRAEGFELGGELGGLVPGSGDEDALVGEWLHSDDSRPCCVLHGLVPLPVKSVQSLPKKRHKSGLRVQDFGLNEKSGFRQTFFTSLI